MIIGGIAMNIRLTCGVAALAGLAACSNPSTANKASAADNGTATATVVTPAPTPTPTPAPTPTARDLSDLIDFAKPADCKLGPNMTKMAGSNFAAFDDKTNLSVSTEVHLPGVTAPIRSVVTHPHPDDPAGNYFLTIVPLQGVWHGLPVAGLAQQGYEESEIDTTPGVVFAASPAQVVPVLRKAGFKLSNDGSELDRPSSGDVTVATQLAKEGGPGHTIFWCTYYSDDSGD
jgi:hypothetical protein